MFRVEEGGPILSQIVAGLFGGFAVVWLLIGAVTYGILMVSNLTSDTSAGCEHDTRDN